MSKPKLKPCPFCGESNEVGGHSLKGLERPHHEPPPGCVEFVGCHSCGTFGPLGDSIREAVAAWNIRVSGEAK